MVDHTLKEDVVLKLCLAQDTNISPQIDVFLYVCVLIIHKSIIIDKTKDPREAKAQAESSALTPSPKFKDAQLLRAPMLGIVHGERFLESTI